MLGNNPYIYSYAKNLKITREHNHPWLLFAKCSAFTSLFDEYFTTDTHIIFNFHSSRFGEKFQPLKQKCLFVRALTIIHFVTKKFQKKLLTFLD